MPSLPLSGGNVMAKFRNNVAMKFGIQAAVIAEHLWYLYLNEAYCSEEKLFHGSYWCRCSQMDLMYEFPCLTRHMVQDALAVLRKNRVIRKGCYNESKFDNTSWWTFTDYGVKMMEAAVPRLSERQEL